MKIFTSVFLTLLLLSLLSLASSSSSFITAAPNTKRVLSYTETWLQSTDASITSGHWAEWDAEVIVNGTTPTSSIRDDSVHLAPLNICPPLYSRPSNHIFIDSNGFLSLQPFSMCGMFCSSDYSNIGNYAFNSAGTKGDWPMISGWLYDLDPAYSGTIKVLERNNGTAGFIEESTVEYYQVPPFRAYSTVGKLRMQIVLKRDGTIIIRYESVPTEPYFMWPVTGLDLSKTQRTVLASTTSNANLSRWRLDPVFDPCQAHDDTDCNTCLSADSYPEGLCYWCQSTKQCVNEKVAVDICAGTSDTFKNISLGQCSADVVQREPTLPLENNTIWEQVFYKNSLNSRGKQTLGAASVSQVNFDTFPGAKHVVNQTSHFPATVPLPFNFSFFNFPINPASSPETTTKKWTSDSVKIYKSGIVKFSSDDTLFPWPETCDPTGGYCSTFAFPPSVNPFSTTSVGVKANSFGTDDAKVLMIELPTRAPAENTSVAGTDSPFCDAALAATNTADPTKCAPAVGFEIRWLRHRDTIYIASIPDIRVEMRVRVFIDQMGNVASWISRVGYDYMSIGNCGEDQEVATLGGWVYPHPFVGLSRNGVNDYSSISIPNAAVADDQVLIFTPVKGCPSCNGNGACNTTSNECVCKSNYGGEDCLSCATGYYGSQCTKCPACQNGGTCDDGITGSGSCVCSGIYSGEFCEVSCSSPAAASCSSCSLFGGVCTCGTCSCKSDDGWYGSSCSEWRDPCDRASLAGCSACNKLRTKEGEACFYCNDDGNERCMSQSTRPGINTSLLGYCGAATTSCSYYSLYPISTSLEFNGTLGIIAFILLTILVVAALVALFCCRGINPNPFVIHAVPGVPDFRRPPKERSVIQIRVVDPRRIGLLQGVPLKSVPIVDLYRYQKARRSGFEGGQVDAPGKEYIDERIQEAQEMARRFETAGPLPHTPNSTNNASSGVANPRASFENSRASPRGGSRRNNNNNNNTNTTTSPNTRSPNTNNNNARNSNNTNYTGVPPELAGIQGYQVTVADDQTPPPPPMLPDSAVGTPANGNEGIIVRRHTPQDV